GVVYLSSFNPKTAIETGSSYLNRSSDNPRTDDVVFVPQLRYNNNDISIMLGTTPLGGTVSPKPVARLKYTQDKVSVTAFHESVTDSLLSYTGFTDVHTGQKMGRVIKTGSKVEYNGASGQNFYGLAASGAYLYGENVKGNTAVKGEAYGGKSFGRFSAGLYLSADHFANDLNHFTFGHGGYYSPTVALATAVFAAWEETGENTRIKIDTSVGHLYEEIRSTAKYFRTEVSGGEYESEKHNKFTTNTGLELAHKLTDSLDLSASMRLITSGEYFEGRAAVALKISFYW
ncbi:MAG: cellulose synthase subunit BcsC-related outer membrane protein, partial [Candidatus Adiutrix sp.]